MQQLKWRRWLMITVMGLITLGGVLDGNPQSNSTNEPDFSKVKDILGRQRHHLLRNDDLVVSYGSTEGHGTSNTVLKTTHSSISKEEPRYTVGAGAAPTHFWTAVGRMFNLPNDVIVSVAASDEAICPVSPCLVVNIRDDVRKLSQSQPLPVPAGQSVGPVHLVTMSDFAGDGYADVFVYYDCG